jgi:hypothetical protein
MLFGHSLGYGRLIRIVMGRYPALRLHGILVCMNLP